MDMQEETNPGNGFSFHLWQAYYNYLAVCISGQLKPTREEQIGSKLNRTGNLEILSYNSGLRTGRLGGWGIEVSGTGIQLVF